MAISKTKRAEVYNKFGGRCAYCGREIALEAMQIEHIIPQWRFNEGKAGVDYDKDDIRNLLPTCRICNHYKRGLSLEEFRKRMLTLHDRIADDYIHRVAVSYRMIEERIKPFNGLFYFETHESARAEQKADFLRLYPEVAELVDDIISEQLYVAKVAYSAEDERAGYIVRFRNGVYPSVWALINDIKEYKKEFKEKMSMCRMVGIQK